MSNALYTTLKAHLTTATNVVLQFILDSNRSAQNDVIGEHSFRWNGTEVAKIECQAGADTGNKDEAELSFKTSDAGVLLEALRLLQNGDVKASIGNFVVGTSGKGVDFSIDPNAAGMTSEILDDYEEGTFTASLTIGVQTFTDTLAKYVKVGRLVHIQLALAWTDDTSTEGAWSDITGIPFTASGNATMPIYRNRIGKTNTHWITKLTSATTAITIQYRDEGVGSVNVPQGSETANSGSKNLFITGTYYTNE